MNNMVKQKYELFICCHIRISLAQITYSSHIKVNACVKHAKNVLNKTQNQFGIVISKLTQTLVFLQKSITLHATKSFLFLLLLSK